MTIRRTDLFERGAALRHDLGNAERAADFDQLTPGDDHVLAARQRVERQQHRGGIVVHDRGCFRAREITQELFDDVLTPPTCALGHVVLEVDSVASHGVECVDRRARKERSTQVCVKHGARRVDDAYKSSPACRQDAPFQLLQERGVRQVSFVNRASLSNGTSQLIEELPALSRHVLAAEGRQQPLARAIGKQPIDRRKLSQRWRHVRRILDWYWTREKDGARWHRWSSKSVWRL